MTSTSIPLVLATILVDSSVATVHFQKGEGQVPKVSIFWPVFITAIGNLLSVARVVGDSSCRDR